MRVVYQKILKTIKLKLKKFYDFVTLKSNENESIFQWSLRSLMIPTGDGNTPSWTYTLIVYFSLMFGGVFLSETEIAQSLIKEYDPTGKIIKEYMKGYSTGFWSLMITLAASIVFFIKYRDARYKNKEEKIIEPPEPTEEEKKDPSIIQTAIDTVKEVFKK